MTIRRWGKYNVIWSRGSELKVKYIRVNPNSGLSFQKHTKRNELWFVVTGKATIKTYGHIGAKAENVLIDKISTDYREKHHFFYIHEQEWHQLINETNEPLIIIEIQFGKDCNEEDIERLFYYD